MAKTAMTELQQQIEAIRREAFAAGYAAAMQAVRELASRSAPGATTATAAPGRRRRRRGRPRTQGGTPATRPTRRRRATRARTASRATTRARITARSAASATGRRRAGGRPKRGANAQLIGEILRAAAPRAIPPADIRRALQQKGVELAFTSIRHALGQLQQRNAAQPVGSTNTWRYRGG